MLWRIGDYVAQHFESIRSGCKGGSWLEPQVATANVRIALADVGWIGHNEIEASSGDRREPVSFLELDMTCVMLRSIFLCNRQSLWRHIDSNDAGQRPQFGERDSDASTPRTRGENASRLAFRGPLQSPLHPQFGLGAR